MNLTAQTIRPLTPGMRQMLLSASALVFVIGVPLLLASAQTAEYFAWTVQPPLTAAFLGAAYWASCVLELSASREHLWARARIAVPAVLTFTALTLVVTLLHINRFHFNFAVTDADARTTAWSTLTGTWVWLLVYALVPVVMGTLLVLQLRVPGGDPPRIAPMAGPVRAVFLAQAALMLAVGLGLLLAPLVVGPFWPWRLTPLTGRAIGAWLIGIGIAAGQLAIENDWSRVRAAVHSFLIFAGLELLVLVRYGSTLDWGTANSWAYLVFLLSLLAVSLYAFGASRGVARS